ncbi:MAG: hypothetical protein ACFCUX_07015 [Candidatus Methylacidiphilales bacterium]
MSLKHIHILFVIACTGLSVILALLFLGGFQETDMVAWLWVGIMCLVASVLLPLYGFYFWQKLKRLGVYN